MEAQFQELLRMLAGMKEELKAEMKSGQEEMKAEMKSGQEEMKAEMLEMKTSQVEMKSEMLSEMKTSQVEMKSEMLSEMKSGQGAITTSQEHMEQRIMEEIINRQDEIKASQEQMEQRITEEIKLRQEQIKEQITAEMGNKIESVENKLESVENKVESVENKVESVENKVEDKLLVFEKRLKSLETRPTMHIENGAISSGPKTKLLTFDGQTSWTVFKKQFNIVCDANGWDESIKATQLATALRGSAAEILQSIPAEKLGDLKSIQNALESRFGEEHLRDCFRAELKARRQKSGETLQELATDIERLMQAAFPSCPSDVRDSLAAQYFTDALHDEEIQQATRLTEAKDLRAALVYAMKFEAARSASKNRKHIRSVAVEKPLNEARCIEDSRMDRIEQMLTELLKERIQKPIFSRRRATPKCWACNKEGHLQRNCRAPKDTKTSTEQEKIETGCLGGRRQSFIKNTPKRELQISALCGGNRGLYIDGFVGDSPCSMLVDTGANVTLLRTDIVEQLKEPRLYTVPGINLKTATGDSARVYGKLDVVFKCGASVFKHRVYVADITDQCILGLDFLQEHGFTVDLEKNELRTKGEEIPLIPANMGTVQAFSIVTSESVIIPPRCECLIRGALDSPTFYRYAVTDRPTRMAQKGILIAASLVDLKHKVIPVRAMNMEDKPVRIEKGTEIATCSPAVDIVTRPPDEDGIEHLNIICDNLEGLDGKQSKAVRQLILKFRDLFSKDEADVGCTSLAQHRINTGANPPIKQYPRRLPLAKKEEVQEIVENMQRNNIIEPSSGPWSSPIVLVKKKDGSTRFCVDYRRLNDITKKDSYPLPRIDDTLDALSGSKWFSTLDLKSGYWQVEVHPDDREKTAFTTGQGLWQFKVMPFGLCNAPATFERLMETVLKGLSYDACLVYLDDIIIVGRTFEEHLENIRQVFEKLKNANLKLNPQKCRLFRREVKYLGHIISHEGVKTDPEKTSAVKEWPRPTTVHELRSFLGLCSYYRRFVKNFSAVAKPLNRLTESGKEFQWTDECEAAFNILKEVLTSAPILAYPQPDKPFILDTDASKNGIGSVLSQVSGREERVVAYFSKSLGKSERNYCVTRKELLAIVKSVEHFHHYLYGRKFILRTDHASLKWLLNFKDPEGQVARWIQRLEEYDFDIEHRKGTSHGNADALSRRPCTEECRYCANAERKFGFKLDMTVKALNSGAAFDLWSPDELQKSQLNDPDIEPILRRKMSSSCRPTWQEVSGCGTATKRYWALWDSLHIRDGVLYRKWESEDGKSCRWQLILPRNRIEEVLKEIHDSPSGGHFGIMKTLSKVRERFYWDRLRSDVEKWCRDCHACGARKGPKVRTRGRLQRYNVGAPFERIALDILGPLPETEKGNRYILVIMDYFTKWPEAVPIHNQEAATVAEALVQNWISRYGVPLILHSDQGTNFNSALFKELCDVLRIQKTRTTALHPQSDGMVERFNRTILNHLSMYVAKNQKDWDVHIPLLLLAYRSAVHETTGWAPSEILLGKSLRLPCDLLFGRPSDTPSSVNEYVRDLEARLECVHQFVRDRINLMTERMKTRYDSRATARSFNEGDRVWLFNPTRRRGLSPKLQQNWEGPYTIIKKLNDVVVRIQKTSTSKPRIIHVDRIAPFHEK